MAFNIQTKCNVGKKVFISALLQFTEYLHEVDHGLVLLALLVFLVAVLKVVLQNVLRQKFAVTFLTREGLVYFFIFFVQELNLLYCVHCLKMGFKGIYVFLLTFKIYQT